MKSLINTKLFCMLEKLDGTFNPDEEEIKQNYDDFVHRVTLVCNSMKGEVPAYFTLHYTRLELERFQILLNNKGVGKKCPYPRLYYPLPIVFICCTTMG